MNTQPHEIKNHDQLLDDTLYRSEVEVDYDVDEEAKADDACAEDDYGDY